MGAPVPVVVSPGEVRSGYRELDRIEDPDGIIGIISMRVNGPPLVTIGIFKVFERDGEAQKTSFWGLKQVAAVRRVLDIAVERAQKEEDRCREEYEVRAGKRRA